MTSEHGAPIRTDEAQAHAHPPAPCHLLQPRPSDPAPAEEIATLLDDDSERIKHTCGHGAVGSMSICWLAREHVIRDDRMPAQDLGQGVHIVEIAVCDPQGANTAPATARQ